jgi:hypothetical protein
MSAHYLRIPVLECDRSPCVGHLLRAQAGDAMTAAPIHLDDDIEQAGAFYPGLTHSLYGESESGKSLIAQWAVIEQLAADQRVLYVDFESTADQIVPRLVALAAGYGLDLRGKVAAGLLDYVSPQGRITQTFIDNYLAPGRYAMAIVDGVTASISMWGAKSNSATSSPRGITTCPSASRG